MICKAQNIDRLIQKVTCGVVGCGFAVLTGMFIACLPHIWSDLCWSSLGDVYVSSVYVTVFAVGICFFTASAVNGLYTALFDVEM